MVHPKLNVGDTLELHYYRRLGQMDALYSVVPENYNNNYPDNDQPLLSPVVASGIFLYLAGAGSLRQAFLTSSEAAVYATVVGGSVSAQMYQGKEAWNWLRDAHERIILVATLRHVGAYLMDTELETKSEQQLMTIIEKLNREDKFRKAKGGNLQINVNTGGMI